MYARKKRNKWLIAVTLLVVLSIASVIIVYAVITAPFPVVPGVKVGDTFTYRLMGYADLGANATLDPSFSDYNNTRSYVVTVTGVNGTQVTLETTWEFNNGTIVPAQQVIDLSNGLKSDMNGFWVIYTSGLSVGDLLRPRGYDGLTVNMTETWNYTSGSRQTDFYQIGPNSLSPTGNETWLDYRSIFFDKQTGMLTSFVNVQTYYDPNSNYYEPYKTLTISYVLTQTNVWEF